MLASIFAALERFTSVGVAPERLTSVIHRRKEKVAALIRIGVSGAAGVEIAQRDLDASQPSARTIHGANRLSLRVQEQSGQ